MNLRAVILFIIFCITGSLTAQDTIPDIGPGVIRVTRTPISPYFKVEYTMTRMLDPTKAAKKNNKGSDSASAQGDNGNGWKFEKTEDRDDSLTLERGARVVFPTRTGNMSQHYAGEISYFYSFADTPRVDTMHVGLWINTQGRIRQVYIREKEQQTVPRALYDQVIGASLKLKRWEVPGGYWPRKRFLHKQKFVKDHFYCQLYVIITSYPQNLEQKTSGARYSTKDVCLNEPKLPEPRKKRKREKTESDERAQKN